MNDELNPDVEDKGSPTGGVVLSEADGALLARAIKLGNEPQRPALGNVLTDGVLCLLAIGFLVGAWIVLHHWRPAVSVSYSQGPAFTASTLNSWELGSPHRPVNWTTFSATASAVDLTVGEIGDVVVLPVKAKLCPQIAKALSGDNGGSNPPVTCDSGELATQDYLEAMWNSPQFLYYLSGSAHTSPPNTVDLQLTPSPSAAHGSASGSVGTGGPMVQVAITGSGQSEWCVPTPSGLKPGSSPSLELETTKHDHFTVRDFVSNSCTLGATTKGLLTVVEPAVQGVPMATLTDLVDTTMLTFEATTASIKAKGLAGSLQLGDDGTYALSPLSAVTLETNHSTGLQDTLQFFIDQRHVDGNGATIIGQASGAWNGPTKVEPNLVTSWWDSESSISIPLFIALAGLFFNLGARFLVDAQKRWLQFSGGKGPNATDEANS